MMRQRTPKTAMRGRLPTRMGIMSEGRWSANGRQLPITTVLALGDNPLLVRDRQGGGQIAALKPKRVAYPRRQMRPQSLWRGLAAAAIAQTVLPSGVALADALQGYPVDITFLWGDDRHSTLLMAVRLPAAALTLLRSHYDVDSTSLVGCPPTLCQAVQLDRDSAAVARAFHEGYRLYSLFDFSVHPRRA